MAKTYTAVTAANATAGNAILASDHSTNFTNVNNLIVPAAAQVVRTSDLTGYTSGSAITWSTTPAFDTDGMFSSGSPTILTIKTAGLYVVSFCGETSATATLTRVLAYIDRNGAGLASQDAYGNIISGNFAVHTVVSLAATDTLSANVQYSGGSAYVIKGNATLASAQTRLTATWIGRTS